MSTSPYLSLQIKQYMKKHNIQHLINKTVNDLLKTSPEDPYAFIIGELQKLTTPTIQLVHIHALEVLSGDGFPVLKFQVKVLFLNKEIQFWINNPFGILSDQNMLYDQDRQGGKGLLKSIKFLKEKVAPKMQSYKCHEQSDLDKDLEAILTENNNLGLYVINAVSYLPALIQAQVLSKSLYSVFSELVGEVTADRPIKMMVNCLQGGKAIASKCKVFKYYLICKNVKDSTLVQSVLQAVRKAIVSGKGGEAALKLSTDGTFICPLDTILDNLKIVEDAIVSCNAKDTFTIGLSFQADTFFTSETKKYELENPKTPFDNDQMIDYLIKLLADKPVIQYLEDPLAFSQKAAWKKLITKIRQNQILKNVKIGSRNGKMFNLNDPSTLKQQINDISIDQTADSHTESTEESRKLANLLKFSLDFLQVRAFELKTVSNLVRVRKQFERTKVQTELIIQDNGYETYDTTLIDLCYGLNCYSNLGSIQKYDRISKLQRVKEIIEGTRID